MRVDFVVEYDRELGSVPRISPDMLLATLSNGFDAQNVNSQETSPKAERIVDASFTFNLDRRR